MFNLSEFSVIVGSKNPVKVNAAKDAFVRALSDYRSRQLDVPSDTNTTTGSKSKTLIKISAVGVSVPSGVSDQPVGNEETMRGAITRAKNALATLNDTNRSQFQFAIGMEGGLERINGKLFCMAWMCCIRINQDQNKTKTLMIVIYLSVKRQLFNFHLF